MGRPSHPEILRCAQDDESRHSSASLPVTITSQQISSTRRVGISVHKSLLSRVNYKALTEIDAMTAVHLPMSERVLDKLADILFATDEILDMIRVEEQLPDPTAVVVGDSVQRVYDQINELMKKLAD